jgi:uncharacterized protein (DUF983 family)
MANMQSFIKGRCPKCGEGRIFVSSNPYNLRKMLEINKYCPVCHEDFIPELGFYWGASYMAYVLTVAFSGITFLISTLLFGFMNSLSLTYVAVNGVLLFLFCPLFFRFSRVLWLWVAR